MIDGGSFGGAGKVTIKDLTITQGLATEDATFPASGGDNSISRLTSPQGQRADREPGAAGGAGAMIYRGSLTTSGSTWSNNLIIGGVSRGRSAPTRSSMMGRASTCSAAACGTFDYCTFTAQHVSDGGLHRPASGISAEEGTTSRSRTVV